LTVHAGGTTIRMMQHEPSTAASAARRPAPARLPAVFLAVSVAAHAIVFGVLPQFTPDQSPPPPALEVMIAKPQPLPVAPPAPEQPLPPRHKPEPKRTRVPPPAAAKAPSVPQPEPAPPILALPSTQAPAESTFTVPAPKPAEPRGPEQKQQVPSVAVTPPVFNASYLRNPAPHYPLAARRTGEQGTATVRVLVTAEGLPARVDLEKSSGSMHLDNAAIEAVKGWRFKPAQRGTDPVEGWVLVPIVFRLEG
jgi:periplasmic protein TonB